MDNKIDILKQNMTNNCQSLKEFPLCLEKFLLLVNKLIWGDDESLVSAMIKRVSEVWHGVLWFTEQLYKLDQDTAQHKYLWYPQIRNLAKIMIPKDV